jgi:hypothetical protein
VPAGFVYDLVDVVVLIHDHDGQVAAARLRDGECPALGQVDDRCAVQGVAVHPYDGLLIHGRRGADVLPLVHPAGLSLERGEHAVALSAREVVDVDLRPAHG